MEIEFVIPLKPTGQHGLNRLYAGIHWAKRQKQADEMHLRVRAALADAKIPRQPCTEPVRITLLYNSRMDIDNHGYITKLIIDGLKGWVIQDDDRRYVGELVQGFHSLDSGLIIVRVEEIR